MQYNIFLLLIFLISFAACKKENEGISSIQFNGISPRDENGQQLGALDLSDWNLTDEWDDRVFTLFNNQKRNLCLDAGNYIAYNATPNPIPLNGNEFLLAYQLQDSTNVEIRIVDKHYELLQAIDVVDIFGPGYNFAVVRVNELNISESDTIRAYYKLINNNNCELRGHGDIAINR